MKRHYAAHEKTLDDAVEAQSRILYAVFQPVVKLAARFGFSMDKLVSLLEHAYFEELQQNASTLQVVAARSGKSIRTINNLHQSFKANFFGSEQTAELCRRIERVLKKGSFTAQEIEKALSAYDPAMVQQAVAAMVQEGRLVVSGEATNISYSVRHDFQSTVGLQFNQKLDGLTNMLETVTRTIEQRLLGEPSPTAAVRTYSILVAAEKMEAFLPELLKAVRQRCSDFEEDELARNPAVLENFSISVLVSSVPPTDKQGE